MKNLIKSTTLVLAAVLMISTSIFANGAKEKAVEKATETVQSAAPDDWKTLAVQADYLIRKNAGLSSAKQWLDKSLNIKEDSYNLEIMGDYYVKCNLPKEAVVYYIKSMEALKANDASVDTSHIQDKIVLAMN
ncbi:hypothetical protein N6H18_08910 [Reichenbachiella agarivorans]|uniref:Tetratricopeptide repeat-containing protein n=1 Tax=Reichenbachiella agarivorans TaxID=2979464 RepID=A0ABY6CU58_9BACT|nr:hypothetical protein [Reichenbachiella agarivorans]UXP34062.1 hypothetical protein N6H18_08910 [Reichenbachiella agarivorans]